MEPSVYSTSGRQYQKSSCANTHTVPAPPRRSASTFYLTLPPQYLEDAIPGPPCLLSYRFTQSVHPVNLCKKNIHSTIPTIEQIYMNIVLVRFAYNFEYLACLCQFVSIFSRCKEVDVVWSLPVTRCEAPHSNSKGKQTSAARCQMLHLCVSR